MTQDANDALERLNRMRLAEADGLVARCSQLCERVLADMGDRADMSIVQLQHDCQDWDRKWVEEPVRLLADSAPDVGYYPEDVSDNGGSA